MDIEENISKINEHIERVKEYLEYGMPYSEYLDLQISFETILNELEKKDKIINEMAEVLNDFDYDKQCEICHTYICSASVDGTGYMKCIIDYFTNKVEESEK